MWRKYQRLLYLFLKYPYRVTKIDAASHQGQMVFLRSSEQAQIVDRIRIPAFSNQILHPLRVSAIGIAKTVDLTAGQILQVFFRVRCLIIDFIVLFTMIRT